MVYPSLTNTLQEAVALLEPMVKDTTAFVRQGAYIALALIMIQQSPKHPKVRKGTEFGG